MSQIKNLNLIPLLVLACLLLSCEKQANTIEEQNIETDTTVINQKSIAAFDVVIKLVDENSGQDVDATTLSGYAATNLETGEVSYTSRYEVNLFESLPVGTYRFDAYDGYFDGASSVVAEISSELENEEGWIEITLKYWSE
ncbi:hypothetical protein [Aquimarina pacifica]|uniref:hypothetical protein n=1 Tax=Aquimarina pacifica TaxID=1296415 RepID=UPI00046E9089|nr:hypothetical protein [Aquimarina pacifica]